MRRRDFLLALGLTLLLPGSALAAIAHDATGSFGASPTTTSPMEWLHNPVGTPRGIIVLIATNDTTDTVTGVTYDGVAMTLVRRQNVGGENGSAYGYFLGASIPATDPATISVTFTGVNNHMGTSASVTAADDTSVEHHLGLSNVSLDDPSITLTTSVTTMTYGALYSGLAGPTSTDNDANHTTIQETDLGAETSSCIHRNAPVAAGSPVVGWVNTGADDVAAVALAVREGVPAVTRRVLVIP